VDVKDGYPLQSGYFTSVASSSDKLLVVSTSMTLNELELTK